jgi:CRISPR-associated protein Cst1
MTNLDFQPAFLTQRTGDPFADTGAYVFQLLQEKSPDKNLLQLIEEVTEIYVRNWGGGINAFFLNSKITQPSYLGERKKEESMAYFKRLLNNEEPYEEGYCRILGQQAKIFSTGRDNHILAGSGTFINFHHGFQDGLKVAKEVIIRMFLVPLGALQLGKNIAVIGSNQVEVERLFVTEVFRANIRQVSQKLAIGVLKSEFSNPANALFQFANQCLSDSQVVIEEEESVEIHLYHFTNFGASPEINLYCFSERLFAFYRKAMKITYQSAWQSFVRDFYRNSKNKGAVYNSITERYDLDVKKESHHFEYQEYRTWFNVIYFKLLNGQSILRDILKWSTRKYQQQLSFNIWPIVELYQTQLYDMKKTTLDKIRQIADYLIEDEDKIKRRLNRLRLEVTNVSHLKRFLIQTIGDHFQEKKPNKPLITLEEFVEELFPEGTYGMEIRDLLMIALYEKLCEKNIPVELEGEEQLEDDKSFAND